MEFSRLLHHFETTYYGAVLLALTELLVIILIIPYIRKYKIGRIFLIYAIFDFSMLMTHWFMLTHRNFPFSIREVFMSITNTLTSLLELGVYYYYFSKVLNNNNINRKLSVMFILYLLLMSIYLTTNFSFLTDRLVYVSDIMSVIEFIFLLPPCFIYYYQLLNTTSPYKVNERPSFWIATGILLFALLSIPYYLIHCYINDFGETRFRSTVIFLFYYLPFSINFIFLTKAIQCKKELTI